MARTLALAHVAWSRRQFAMMKDGGVWGVPRSGIVFQRQGEELVLIDRMPHTGEMPVTPAQLAEQQQADFDVVKAHFEAAGIRVRNDPRRTSSLRPDAGHRQDRGGHQAVKIGTKLTAP